MGVNSTCEIANSPGAMVFPQVDSVCFARGIFSYTVTRGRSNLSRASAAGEIPHFGTSGHVSLLTSLACPRARSRTSRQNAPAFSAAVEENLRHLVGHGRETQSGIGLYAGRISDLSRTTEALHHFTEVRYANARRGGAQAEDHLGMNPGRVGPQNRCQSPLVARFSISRGASLQFPSSKPSISEWPEETRIVANGAEFPGVNKHGLGRLEGSRERIHCSARHPTMRGLHIQKVLGFKTGSWSTPPELPSRESAEKAG